MSEQLGVVCIEVMAYIEGAYHIRHDELRLLEYYMSNLLAQIC